MKYARLLPLAALAFAAACNETSNSPTSPADRPSFSAGTGAHFSNLGASIDLTTSGTPQGTLIVSFRESGLGNSPTPGSVQVEVTAEATAEYACLNGGGKHPQAANKETVNGPVGGTGDFPIGHNGSASGTILVAPPSPGDFSCPPGQTFVLASVSYSTILISDNTNSDNAGVQDVPVPPSSLSATFFTF
jgi:hypothetical protein